MSTEQPGSVYPQLSRTELKQRIQKELEEEGWTKPNTGPQRNNMDQQPPTKSEEEPKKKSKLRRCGKWLLCLPVAIFCCSGKFLCRRAFRCLTCPVRCMCPCI